MKKGRDNEILRILKEKYITISILLVLALISIFVIGRNVKNPSFIWNSMAIADLDSKKDNVLKFTGISAALSTAVTIIPQDIGTPIANELAELTDIFLLILTAITAEKYMVTLSGAAAFYVLIPAGLMLLVLDLFVKKFDFAKLGARLIVFGLLFYLLIPCSCVMSNIIEDTYEESIAMAEEQAEFAKQEIEQYENGGLFDKIKNAYSSLKDTLENALNRQMEVIAVMAVTCCIIPLGVVFVFVWLMKTILNVELKKPDFLQTAGKMPKINGPAVQTAHRGHGNPDTPEIE